MRIFTVLLAVVLAACGISDPAPTEALARLNLEREKWQRLSIRDYDFDVTYTNEWFPAKSVRIEVRGGSVAKVTEKSTGDALESSGWPSVDSLFARAERNLREPERIVELRYDPIHHYPTLIDADTPNWADDAERYDVGGLVRR